MKTFNLNSLGVKELTSVELKENNGGIWQYVFAGLLYLASEFDDIKQGVKDAEAGNDYNYTGG